MTGKRLSVGLRFAALPIVLMLTVGAAYANLPVELIVENPNGPDRVNEPVTSGVPLLHGAVSDVSQLALEDDSGSPVPVQFTVLGRFTDGTPRWVLLDFPATVATGQSERFWLVAGTAAQHPSPIAVSEDSSQIIVQTGPATFVISKTAFNVFEQVTLGGTEVVSPGSAGIEVIRNSDQSVWSSRYGQNTFEIEDLGPLHTVVKVKGDHRRYAGDASHLLEFTVRMHFYAGQSFVRVFYTLENKRNAGHYNNYWDLGRGGYEDIRDCSLILNGNFSGAVSYRIKGDELNPVMTGQVAGDTYLYQDSSGGDNWDHPTHMNRDYIIPVAFRGWKLFRDGAEIDSGLRAVGWMDLTDGNVGITAGIRHFWQNFPNALETNGSQVIVRMFPKYWSDPLGYEIQGGEHKTHEVLLNFHTGQTAEAERLLSALQRPLFARCTPVYYCQSLAFEFMTPENRTDAGPIERYCDAVYQTVFGSSLITDREAYDEYGWRNFGETVADHELAGLPPPYNTEGTNHYNNQYDGCYGMFIQFARRGDLEMFEMGLQYARHIIDIDTYHVENYASDPSYAGGIFTHTTHDIPAFRSTHRAYPDEGDPDFITEHPNADPDIWAIPYDSGGPAFFCTYVWGTATYFFLTGDRKAADQVIEVAEWGIRRADREGRPWRHGDRVSGNRILLNLYAYQITQDPKYYDEIIETLQDNDYSYINSDTSWSMSWHVDAVSRFLQWKMANETLDSDYQMARDHLMEYAWAYLNRYVPSSSYWRLHDSDAIMLCYLHAPDGHPYKDPLLTLGTSEFYSAMAQLPSWIQAKNLHSVLNSGHAGMYVLFGVPEPPPNITAFSPALGTVHSGVNEPTQIVITFSKDVTISASDVQVFGFTTGFHTDFVFGYDNQTYQATLSWSEPLEDDTYIVMVNDTVQDSRGSALDGEISDPVNPALPSGDGEAGGDFVVYLYRLAGDANADLAVDVFDVIIVINAFGTAPGDPGWDARADFNDSGNVDVFDVITVVNQFGKTIPAGL